jgi:hypothetical protein
MSKKWTDSCKQCLRMTSPSYLPMPAHGHISTWKILRSQGRCSSTLLSRARNVPLTFAASEHDFSPLAVMSHCGPEPELAKYWTRFGKNPVPAGYSMTVLLPVDLNDYVQDADGWDFCMRPSLQILYIQERIMRFLVGCCKAILHDIVQTELETGPILKEPPASELALSSNGGHVMFSDALAVAPYRKRGSMTLPGSGGTLTAS